VGNDNDYADTSVCAAPPVDRSGAIERRTLLSIGRGQAGKA